MRELDEYIEQHCSEESVLLQHITRQTNLNVLNPHMLSGRVQGRVLSMLSCMIQPEYVLELGTFTGYSALCLAEGLKTNGELHTVEHNDELEQMILENFSKSEFAQNIHLHIGDALNIIPTLDYIFDLVFIDADKRQYTEYYEAVLPKVRTGGFILADNTLWDSHIIDRQYDRDKQTLGLRRFNDHITADKRVEQVILPLRDGLTLIRKL